MPQVKDGPKKLNELLESVYSSCIGGGGSKTSCSKQAWGAAANAGWKKDKDGKWKKTIKVSKRIEKLEDELGIEVKKNKGFWKGVL